MASFADAMMNSDVEIITPAASDLLFDDASNLYKTTLKQINLSDSLNHIRTSIPDGLSDIEQKSYVLSKVSQVAETTKIEVNNATETFVNSCITDFKLKASEPSETINSKIKTKDSETNIDGVTLPEVNTKIEQATSNSASKFDSIGNEYTEFGKETVDNWSNLGQDLGSEIINIASDTATSIADSFTSALLNNTVSDYINNPMSLVQDMISPITNLISNATNLASEAIEYGKGWVQDKIDGAVNKVKDTIAKPFNSLNDKINSVRESLLYNISNSDKDTITNHKVKESNLSSDKDTITNYSLEDSKTNKNDNLNNKEKQTLFEVKTYTPSMLDMTRKNFTPISETLELSDDMYWNLDINPHHNTHNELEPPSLKECFNNMEILPITSYSFQSPTLGLTTSEMAPGVPMSIISQYTRPSAISIQMPELVQVSPNSTSVLCFQKFKDSYLEYATNSTISKIPKFRDFRDCAYEIVITKFDRRWTITKEWKLLGIPEFVSSDQGGANSAAEFVTLLFQIVGEFYPDKKPVVKGYVNESINV